MFALKKFRKRCPNFKGRVLVSSITYANCHVNICSVNICPGNNCQYQEYLSCYWTNFDETLKASSWELLEQIPTVPGTFVQATITSNLTEIGTAQPQLVAVFCCSHYIWISNSCKLSLSFSGGWMGEVWWGSGVLNERPQLQLRLSLCLEFWQITVRPYSTLQIL